MAFDLGSLFVKLGFDIPNADTAKISIFTDKVTSLSTAFLAVRQFAGDAVTGINQVIAAQMDDSARLQSFTKQTDLSIASLNKWRLAMYRGDPTQGFDKTIDNVQAAYQNLQKIMISAGNVSTFQTLGISIYDTNKKLKNTYDIMDDLARIIKQSNVPLGIMEDRLQRAGFSTASISGFKYMADHYEEIKKYAKIEFVSPENSERITAVTEAFGELNKAWGKFWGDVLASDSGALVEIAHDLILAIDKLDHLLKPIGKTLLDNKAAAVSFTGALAAIASIGSVIGGLNFFKEINALSKVGLLGSTGTGVASAAEAGTVGTGVASAVEAGTVGAGAVSAIETGTVGVGIAGAAEAAGGTGLAGLGAAGLGVGGLIAVVTGIALTVGYSIFLLKNTSDKLSHIDDSIEYFKDRLDTTEEPKPNTNFMEKIHNLFTPKPTNENIIPNTNLTPATLLPKGLPTQLTPPTNIPSNINQTNNININSTQPIEDTKRIAEQMYNEKIRQAATNTLYHFPRSM